MLTLDTRACLSCSSASSVLDRQEITRLLSEVPEYTLTQTDGVQSISKIYTFKNFKDALAFVNKLSIIAEEENHHPKIILEWGKVQISWWTHTINALAINDFIMAAKTETLK